MTAQSCTLFLLAILSTTVLLTDGAITRPKTKSEADNMIFIRGKWFSRNGQSNLETKTADVQLFPQCLDHFAPNGDGCETLWNQVYLICC